MNKERKEKRETSATYRNFKIWSTSWGRYIAVIHGVSYPPCDTFNEAAQIIDDYWKSREN